MPWKKIDLGHVGLLFRAKNLKASYVWHINIDAAGKPCHISRAVDKFSILISPDGFKWFKVILLPKERVWKGEDWKQFNHRESHPFGFRGMKKKTTGWPAKIVLLDRAGDNEGHDTEYTDRVD
jgi:hypothetical protein